MVASIRSTSWYGCYRSMWKLQSAISWQISRRLQRFIYLNSHHFNPSGIPPGALPTLYAHRAEAEKAHGTIPLSHFDTVHNLSYAQPPVSGQRYNMQLAFGRDVSLVYSKSIQRFMDWGKPVLVRLEHDSSPQSVLIRSGASTELS